MENLITISPSPHAHTPTTVTRLMLHVIIALIPAVLVALYYFGIIAITLVVLVLLHFSLKRREKYRDNNKNQQ